MCTTIIGTPRNSYEQNVTEYFVLFIIYFLKLIRGFRNIQAVIHYLLFHWGHIPLFILCSYQHGKDKKQTNQMREMCVELHKSTWR